jgi:hypothetical protein
MMLDGRPHSAFMSTTGFFAGALIVLSLGLFACEDVGTPLPVPARIDSIMPDTLTPGGVAEIRGSGFEQFAPSHRVVFSKGIEARTYLDWSDVRILAVVPSGAETGGVFISKNGVESNVHRVILVNVGVTGGPLLLSPPSVVLVPGGQGFVLISGGIPPYAITQAGNSSVVQVSLAGNAITLQAAGIGATAVVISDATTPTAKTISLTVTVQQSGVSFANEIIPIFTAHCTSCHGGTANLHLTPAEAYTNLVNIPAGTGDCAGTPRVTPGNSSASALYLRVSGMCSARMPLGGSLTPAQIDRIRQWIDQGALNN